MALVIEDGTIVEGANSFVTVAEIRAYATARGVSLPVADGEVEPFAVTAWDFIASLESRMLGVRTDPEQEGPYPRTGVVIYSAELLPDAIPSTLKKAQMQLALDVSLGVPIFTDDTAEPAVKREKVGPIETEFFDGGGSSSTSGGAALSAAWGYLSPLLRGLSVRTLRI